jgi:hypothetical protein
MNEAGYTATEALAALAILGLAVGGLAAGLKVLGQGQLTTSVTLSDSVSVRTVRAELEGLLQGEGPFRSDAVGAFSGDRQSLRFPCAPQPCSAQLAAGELVVVRGKGSRRLRLPARRAYDFAYVAGNGRFARWPQPDAEPWRPLSAVALVDRASGLPLVTAPVWVQQAADCEFDTVSRDCRRSPS